MVDGILGVLTRRRYHHLQRLPAEGPVVVVANHISLLDPLVIICALRRVGRRATFLAMVEAFSWPVVGWLLRRTEGRCVALYPEGRISTEPDLRLLPRGRTGAVRLALAAGCPIVPVSQWGAQDLLPPRRSPGQVCRLLLGRVSRSLRPGSGRVPLRPRVTVVVGEPITPAELAAAAPSGVDLSGTDLDPAVRLTTQDAAALRAATALVMDRLRELQAGILDGGPGSGAVPGERPGR